MAANNTSEHVRVWRYRVKPGCRKEFEHHYSGEGTWTQLFNRVPGYLGTTFWQDASDKDIYYTHDRWQDAAAFEKFQQEFGLVYEQMDKELEGLTAEEQFLGAMNRVD